MTHAGAASAAGSRHCTWQLCRGHSWQDGPTRSLFLGLLAPIPRLEKPQPRERALAHLPGDLAGGRGCFAWFPRPRGGARVQAARIHGRVHGEELEVPPLHSDKQLSSENTASPQTVDHSRPLQSNQVTWILFAISQGREKLCLHYTIVY